MGVDGLEEEYVCGVEHEHPPTPNTTLLGIEGLLTSSHLGGQKKEKEEKKRKEKKITEMMWAVITTIWHVP